MLIQRKSREVVFTTILNLLKSREINLSVKMLQIVTKTMREIYPYSDTSLSDPVLQDLISAMTKLL